MANYSSLLCYNKTKSYFLKHIHLFNECLIKYFSKISFQSWCLFLYGTNENFWLLFGYDKRYHSRQPNDYFNWWNRIHLYKSYKFYIYSEWSSIILIFNSYLNFYNNVLLSKIGDFITYWLYYHTFCVRRCQTGP